jgi:homoserine O-succinyltransferase
VFFQGHPEYDTISLLKEYKREVSLYCQDKEAAYPPMPKNYLSLQNQAILNEYQTKLVSGDMSIQDFPEGLVASTLDNTWHDSANAIINNWIGCVYQLTNEKINKPFMSGIDPENPLGLI